MKFFILLPILFLSVSTEMTRFDNYQVHTVTVENSEQLDALKYLDEKSDSYELWDTPYLNRDTEILVPPHMRSDFADISSKLNLKTKLIIDNLQTLIDNETPKRAPRAFGWTDYYRLADIYTWLDQMATNHPNTQVRTVGRTFEGRDIKLFSIARSPFNRNIIIESNIHAREWISSATSTWLINELLTSTNATIQNLANTINWYIIPVQNPDGLEYTKTSNRNWRKTRKNVTALCWGVDANRNMEFNWLVPDETGNEGASRTPCSDTYAGAYPFSEEETVALNSVLTQYADKTDLFFSFHSYGHYLLHPWGTTQVPAPNQASLDAVGRAGQVAIRVRDNVEYIVGSSNLALYAASGTTPDHAYGSHQIPLAYTVEMRGNGAYGNYGFFLPPEFIIPNALEVFDGVVAMIREARNRGYLN